MEQQDITLDVNGEKRAYRDDPAMPLLWVLRDVFDLPGTKYGCGIGSCGACMVHVDGVAVRSCQMSAADAAGKKITTIEGLSKDGDHLVQEAWVQEGVSQCGYCQPGQIMAAAALLAKIKSPTDTDIDKAMSGNLCRCGTYPRIRRAIHAAAQKGG